MAAQVVKLVWPPSHPSNVAATQVVVGRQEVRPVRVVGPQVVPGRKAAARGGSVAAPVVIASALAASPNGPGEVGNDR